MTVQTFGSSATMSSFPTNDTTQATGSVLDSQMASAQQIAATLTAATFTSDYMGGSSTQAAQFITGGKINSAGIQWIAYKLLPESDRVTLQDQMVTAGALAPASVTGEASSASDTAFRSLLGIAQSQNTPVATVLALANDNGIGPIQQQLSANIAAATAEEAKPVTISESNPSTIEAAANQAWTQTLGYAPSASQLSGMVSLIQGQDVTAAEAPRAAAAQEISQAQSEESALNKLGPDGVDTVVAAYHAAVNGLNVPGAGTSQGPAIPGQMAMGPTPLPEQVPASTGKASPAAPQTGPAPPVGPAAPQGINALPTIRALEGANNLARGVGPSAVAAGKQVGGFFEKAGQGAANFGKGVAGAAEGIPNLLHNWLFSNPVPNSSNTASNTGKKSGTAASPSNPENQNLHIGQLAPAYGGMFALSPSEWAKAQALTPAAKNYTAGTAPQSVQISAFTNLLLDTFQSTGSWSSAIEQIAGGTPLGTSKGTHLSSFATNVANQVNSQIESAQSQVAAPVDVKVDMPDVAAEANQQAKESDPIGYAASNYSSWAGTLSQMLYGSPTTETNTTSDTFTGPVSPGVAASAPAAA